MTERPARIEMVCTGNICRSPAMHYFAQQQWGDAAQVTSSGIFAEATMDVPAPMRVAAGKHGLEIPRHRSRQLSREILGSADLVLVATDRHARWATDEWGKTVPHMFGIKEAAQLTKQADAPLGSTPRERLINAATALHQVRLEQPAPLRSLDDPYGLDQGTYDRVMDEIVDDLGTLTDWLRLAEVG